MNFPDWLDYLALSPALFPYRKAPLNIFLPMFPPRALESACLSVPNLTPRKVTP